MNKRQIKRVMKLVEDGVSIRDAIKIIIELSKNSGEASDIICQEFRVIRQVMKGAVNHLTGGSK